MINKELLTIIIKWDDKTYTIKRMVDRKAFMNLKRRIKNSLFLDGKEWFPDKEIIN